MGEIKRTGIIDVNIFIVDFIGGINIHIKSKI